MSSPAHCVKLIEVSPQGQFALTSDGGTLLASVKEACDLIFIFGNARSGKSFLMNRLLGCAPKPLGNLFTVINSSLPCTKGVDITSQFVPQSDLNPEAKQPIKVGFVDVEGQGDAGEAHDTLLALPLLLTSKVVLFNHKGAPTVGHMLEKLGVLARAAQKVKSGLEEEEDKEDGPKSGLFGHLHIVFRDFSFDGDEDSVLDQLLTPEQVPREKKTLGMRAGYDPAEAIRDRNEIRRLIKQNFESVHAWIFPQPADPDTLKQHADLPVDLINPAFAEVTKALFQKIVTQTCEPRPFNGKALDGPRIQNLQQLLIDCVNRNSIIDVPSVFRAMEQQRLYHARDVALAQLEAAATALEPQFPLSAESFGSLVRAIAADCQRCFDTMIAGTTLEEEAKTVRAVLTTATEQKTAALEKKNGKQVWALVDHILKLEANNLQDEFRAWCTDKMGCEEEEIAHAFATCQRAQRARIEKALAGVPQVLGTPEYAEKLKASDDKPNSLLAIKVAQNNSVLLDIKAKKIAEESARQLGELMAKNTALLEDVSKIQTESAEQITKSKKNEESALAEKEEMSKKSDDKEKQIRAKNLKVVELTKQRDAEKVAKEKLAKQLEEFEEKEKKAAEEKKELEKKAYELHKEGWLMKKGRAYPRSWQKRYFRVETGILAYYSDADCKDRKGFLSVDLKTTVQTYDPRALKNEKYRYAFQVISDDRSVICKPIEDGAAAQACQKEWKTYLEYVAKGISRDSVKPGAPVTMPRCEESFMGPPTSATPSTPGSASASTAPSSAPSTAPSTSAPATSTAKKT